jgi:hypothetical protein
VTVAAFEGVDDGGELLWAGEAAAVGGRLLIAEGLYEAVGGEARAVDARGEPGWVNAGEEVGDEVQAGAFAAFAGIADEDDEEVGGVAGGFDHAVGAGADEIAEGGEELEEECSWMRFGVGREAADDASGGSVEGGFVELWMGGWLGWGCARRLWLLGSGWRVAVWLWEKASQLG